MDRPRDVRGPKGPPQELDLDDVDMDSTSLHSTESATGLHSAASLIPRSERATSVSTFTSSQTLRRLCLFLHSILLLIHAGLLGIWAGPHLEHHVTFSLQRQDIVSFAITGTTTLVGTIYSSLLLVITQKLATRRVLQKHLTLTATHDNSVAWAGIGSALTVLWAHRAVSSSLMTIVLVTTYLGCIMALHVTTPALFAVQTFNQSQPLSVTTQGLPEFNRSFTSTDFAGFSAEDTMGAYARHVLKFLPWIENMTATEKVGLEPGTLYDILEVNSGAGNITMPATGFNISCGFITGVNTNWSQTTQLWTVTLDDSIGVVQVPYTQPGIIGIVQSNFGYISNFSSNVVVLYSTIPVVDSAMETGPSVQLSPDMPGAVSALQFFQCSQSLVKQNATVDAHSRRLLDRGPAITKTSSKWSPYAGPLAAFSNGTMIEMWASWFNYMPSTGIPRNFFINSTNDRAYFLSVAEQYFIQKLNLLVPNNPDGKSSRPPNVSLHDVENSLSNIVSYMFWIMGHISGSGATAIEIPADPQQAHEIQYNVPFLLAGSATVPEIIPAGRLDINIIAISVGLVVSLCLGALAIVFSWGIGKADISVDGTGFLHAIWLFRHSPELNSRLHQVETPTDNNLRAAGMVGIDRGRIQKNASRRHKKSESGYL
ncbi:hypothetical protein C8R44DRAFT_797239 [Mycena epipterygia]|nr:hypothetical protein C8R44DRAFT_797239 [Mycena epipterygia]